MRRAGQDDIYSASVLVAEGISDYRPAPTGPLPTTDEYRTAALAAGVHIAQGHLAKGLAQVDLGAISRRVFDRDRAQLTEALHCQIRLRRQHLPRRTDRGQVDPAGRSVEGGVGQGQIAADQRQRLPFGDAQEPAVDRDRRGGLAEKAKRADRRKQILEAKPWDLLVVDEAHHARRKDFKEPIYRPNRLLGLLNEINAQNKAASLLLMTATPMQVHPLEVWDLLTVLGMGGRWAADK